MIIRKLRLCLADIEVFVNCWGQSIICDLENGLKAAAEHVEQIF